MVGSGQRLPTKDEEEIGLPVLVFLRKYPRSYAMVVDDLEGGARALLMASLPDTEPPWTRR